MTTRKKTTRTKTLPPATRARRSARKAARTARTTGEMMRETWSAAVEALGAAEEETARQLARLLRRNRITAADAGAAIAGLRARLDRERRSLGRTFGNAVHSALASINVPSREEIGELTRKVDELSARIEAMRTKPRVRARRS
jgi:poly(hydroxyalkanoate) granule associated protein phasin